MIAAISSWALSLALVVCCWRARRRLVLVARACHEVRGALFVLQLGLPGVGGEPARRAALELELQRAARALDDLAAAPAGAGGQTRPEPVDALALVASHVPAWRTLAAGYGADLRVEPPQLAGRPGATTTVTADPLRLAQACANLVGNAAEHGGGVVRVRVRALERVVRIEVADDGPGLPRSVGALTASARGRRGPRGHGLAIAAAIAERHGGRLAAAPAVAGARVMLELPLAREAVVA